jgi:hypothetical protein
MEGQMIESIQGAYGAIKGGLDIAQGFQAFKTETAVNQAIIDIQRSLLEAQRALNEAEARHSTDLSRVTSLEQEVVRLKDWTAEQERYHLVDVDRGAFAYMPKPGMENGQPAHWLCANCFGQGHKSLLQFKGQGSSSASRECTYGCDRCKGTMAMHWRRKPTYPGEEEA